MTTGADLPRKRTAVLISGRGSNMLALLQAMQDPAYPAEASLVLSNVPDAPGLASARGLGITTIVLDHKAYTSREAFDRAMDERLRAHMIDIVCLAGFMRLLSAWFCDAWRGRLINIHPSLLPAHKGLNTHRRALEAGDREHGCTVHFVTPDLDGGPVILQAAVPVIDGDDEETLARRVLTEEHRIYPLALAKVATGQALL